MRVFAMSIVVAALGFGARVAHADQCHSNSRDVATAAKRLLDDRRALQFCEPCGDKAPGVPQHVSSVELRPDGPSTVVVMNGREIDLAYVFVQVSPDLYRNVGELAGCSPEDVSATLRVSEETAAGVLITPSGPAAPTPPPVRPPVAAPSAAAVIYIDTGPTLAAFHVLVVACGGVAAGIGVLLVAASLRRRRAMRPRAVDLRS